MLSSRPTGGRAGIQHSFSLDWIPDRTGFTLVLSPCGYLRTHSLVRDDMVEACPG